MLACRRDSPLALNTFLLFAGLVNKRPMLLINDGRGSCR